VRTYIIRRTLQMIPLLIGITVISFSIMHLAPGGPIGILGGEGNEQLDVQQIERLRAKYGLDKPIPVQYVVWLGNLIKGDFGISFAEHRPVLEIIAERLPNTLYLNLVVLILSYALAIPIGVASALRQYSPFDMTVTTLAFWGRAMPNFWLALLLIFAFAIRIDWIPTSGMATYGVRAAEEGFLAVLIDRLRYLLLPVIVLVTSRMTGLTRYMRSSMLEVIREDYIRTARAKGLSERIVIYRHALRNALLPIVTLAGFTLSALFSGSVIIEHIFSWPGLGSLSIRAIWQRDYSVVMAFNTIGAFLTILGLFLSDLAYGLVDPRIRYD